MLRTNQPVTGNASRQQRCDSALFAPGFTYAVGASFMRTMLKIGCRNDMTARAGPTIPSGKGFPGQWQLQILDFFCECLFNLIQILLPGV